MVGATFDEILQHALGDEAERVRCAEAAEYERFQTRFATSAYSPRPSAPALPPCFRTLGLDAGASIDDVRKAFRRLAFAAHPDRGGPPEPFINLETAYRAALRVVAHAA